MEKTKLTKLIVGILIVVLILMIILYAIGALSHDVIVILGLGIICICALLYHPSTPQTKEEREIEKIERGFEKTRVQRTREGTIFEIATALILAASLVIGFATHTFGIDSFNLIGYVGCFIGAILGLVLAYHPMTGFGAGRTFGHVTNDVQFKLLIRKYRVGAIVIALMALVLSINPVEKHLLMVILICVVIAWFGSELLFSILYKKNKGY